MKTIKMLLLVALLSVSNLTSASTGPTNAYAEAIKIEIAKLLKHPKFIIEEDAAFNVTFRVNKQNELVVLDVDTEDKVIADYIKRRLNYKKMTVAMMDKRKTYVFRVRLTPLM